jgi:serine/threonine-protein kinase
MPVNRFRTIVCLPKRIRSVETQIALDDLLDQWEQARDTGQATSPEALCADRPELLEPLRAKIEILLRMNRRLNSHDATQLHQSSRRDGKQPDRDSIPNERPQTQTGYEGLTFHAQGGLGLVFEATDLRLHRRVALKFMHQHLAEIPWARERFLLEAEVTGRLDHPGIVPVHGVGLTETGRPFYAMRFIRGETFDVAIGRYHRIGAQVDPSTRSLEFRALLARFISVCNTLAYAHNCGIIHRDIKPENIMLGRYAETLVVDWGLALSVNRDEVAKRSGESTILPSSGSQAGTSTGGPAGTPAYMAPEQARDCDHVDRRADIYSLGVILYKILCGKLPYRGAHAMEVLEQLRQGKFARPSEVDASVPRSLEAICLRAMAREPDQRYATALELVADLEHWLADEPVAAYREPPVESWTRWLRKHRTLAMSLAGALAAVAILAIGSAIALGTLANSEAQLRGEAEQARTRAELARKQSLRAAALLAAETVGREMDRRWELLEREASDPQLSSLLLALQADPADQAAREKLQSWLTALGSKCQKTAKFDTLFIVNATGVQLAREPLEQGQTIGKNFSRRDYFHGRGRDYAETETVPLTPIQRPNHCAVYKSSSDHSLKIAFSVPIWSDKAVVPERHVLGVLGMSVELNQFGGVLQRKLPGKQSAMLVDLRPDLLAGKPLRGLVLHHPELEKQQSTGTGLPRLAEQLVAKLLERGVSALWEHQQHARWGDDFAWSDAASSTHRPTPLFVNELIEDFRDPVTAGENGSRLAAFSTVMIPGRATSEEGGGPEAALDSGWIVIVEEATEER